MAALVALAGCSGGGTPVVDADDVVVPVVTDEAAAADLLAAYERSRTATFVLEQTWTRAVDGEALAPVPLRVVQRPPLDRLEVGGGSASGVVGGRVVRCTPATGAAAGSPNCLDGPEAGDDAAAVAAEVAELARLLEGRSPAYSVARGEGDDDGCFVLRLRLAIDTAPYGLGATLCFDDRTGAPARRLVDRGRGVTDEFVAVAIRSEVTDADLAVADLGALPETPD